MSYKTNDLPPVNGVGVSHHAHAPASSRDPADAAAGEKQPSRQRARQIHGVSAIELARRLGRVGLANGASAKSTRAPMKGTTVANASGANAGGIDRGGPEAIRGKATLARLPDALGSALYPLGAAATAGTAGKPERRSSTSNAAKVASRGPVASRGDSSQSIHARARSDSVRSRRSSSSSGETSPGSASGRKGFGVGVGGAHAHASEQAVPMTPSTVLRNHASDLSEYELGEVGEFPQVWYSGASAGVGKKIRGSRERGPDNHGYDDDRDDLIIVPHDHLAYRYEIIQIVGKGSFGQVMRCFDHKTKTMKAVKVIRNKKRFHSQALVEVKILEHLRHNTQERDEDTNIVHMHEYFYFREHLCISFELLSINLYEFIKNNNFQGLSLGLVRRFASQLLTSLKFLRKQNVIHCDLKPENILLKQPNKSTVKVIDFGSSCFENERVYTYIQSRFYRSPEVILGMPYDVGIDMWSLGCILAELYTGYPLFPGENEMEQLACIMEARGPPPPKMLETATRKTIFFDADGRAREVKVTRGKRRVPGSKDLAGILRCADKGFVDFIDMCLRWDIGERQSPEQALAHEWITRGTAAPTTSPAAPGLNRARRESLAAGRAIVPAHAAVSLDLAPGGSSSTKKHATAAAAAGGGGFFARSSTKKSAASASSSAIAGVAYSPSGLQAIGPKASKIGPSVGASSAATGRGRYLEKERYRGKGGAAESSLAPKQRSS